MKREIKFRNWDTRLKIWASPSYPLSMYNQTEYLVSQQYIGIKTHKDKKEIYEGDILKSSHIQFAGDTYVVEWSTPYIGFILVNVKTGEHLPRMYIDGVHTFETLEIVGNIYDNQSNKV